MRRVPSTSATVVPVSRRKRIGRPGQAPQPVQQPEDLQGLRQRLEHLEALLEGLQDAVHRDSVRHEERLAELERKAQPDLLAKALSEDARRRGF